MSELVRYDEIRAELERSESVDDLTEAKARIEAATMYARRQKILPAVFDGLELKLRCERRLGEVLATTVRHQGGRPRKNGDNESPFLPKGIDKQQSSRWQRLARVTDNDFEQYLAASREEEKEPTTQGALRLAQTDGLRPEPRYEPCPVCGRAMRADKPAKGVKD